MALPATRNRIGCPKNAGILPRRVLRGHTIIVKDLSGGTRCRRGATVRARPWDGEHVDACTYLTQHFGYQEEDLHAITVKFSCIHSLDVRIVHNNMQALRGLGLSLGQLKACVLAVPPLLECNLKEMLDFFYYYGASPQEVAGMLMRCPEIALCSIYQMGEVMMFLQQGLGMTQRDVVCIVRQAPQVLVKDVHKDLQPVADFLLSKGLKPSLGYYACFGPHVFCASIADDLQPVLTFLCTKLVIPKDRAAALLRAEPSLLLLWASGWLPQNLAVLENAGFSGQEIQQLVCALPAVLARPHRVLERTWQFLSQEVCLSTSAASAFPTVLMAPLKGVIGPRFHFLRDTGRLRPGLQESMQVQGNKGCTEQIDLRAGPSQASPTNSPATDGHGRSHMNEPSNADARNAQAGSQVQAARVAGSSATNAQGSRGEFEPRGIRKYPWDWREQQPLFLSDGALNLELLVSSDLGAFCAAADVSVQEFCAYQDAWWRTTAKQWGGINMQVPEDIARGSLRGRI